MMEKVTAQPIGLNFYFNFLLLMNTKASNYKHICCQYVNVMLYHCICCIYICVISGHFCDVFLDVR